MGDGWIILLIVIGVPVMGVLSIPLLAIWTHHRRKMEEMSLRRQQVLTEDIRAEFAAVRQEIKALRDTTMQYDLSFDTNLHNLERRMTQLEQTARSSYSNDTGITQNMYNRG